MQKLKTLIVEDRETDRNRLIRLLKTRDDVFEIHSIATSLDNASKIISRHTFDLSILDYWLDENRQNTILDLLNVADRRKFGIITLTSVDDRQLVDKYMHISMPIILGKPHTQEAINMFVFRLQDRIQLLETRTLKFITIQTTGGFRKILYKSICFIKAERNNTIFYCDRPDNSLSIHPIVPYKHSESFNRVLEQLDPYIFFESNRSFIINLNRVVRCQKHGRGANVYFTEHGETFIAKVNEDGRKFLINNGYMRTD